MVSDLLVAIRTLRRTPGFLILATVTLALGVAANTAIFSVVRGVLLAPLPYADPSSLVRVWTSTATTPRSSHTAAEFLDVQRENRSLQAIAGYRSDVFAVVPDRGDARQVEGAHVTVDFFDIFGVGAAHGRAFSRGADAATGELAVVLRADAARAIFGDPARAAGARLRVNGEPHTVLGVMAESFTWPAGASMWRLSPRPVPPSPLDSPETDRDIRYFNAIARLRPGVTMADAERDLSALAAGPLASRQPAGTEPRDLRLETAHDDLVGEARPAILLLQAGVLVVFLIACANVSGLVIARNAARRRELAIRAALGAGRVRLIRAVFSESLVLGVAGGGAGLLAGRWALVGLRRLLPENLPRAGAIDVDVTVVTVTLALAVAASALFGAAPAVHAGRTPAAAALRESSRGATGRTRGRAALVVVQIALTFVLLASAGLLLSSLVRLQGVDTGYGPAAVTLAEVFVPQSRYPAAADRAGFYTRLIEGLAARPEIDAAGLGFPAPLRGENASGSYHLEGRAAAGSDRPFAYIASVSDRYLDAMGVRLLDGRTFGAGDTDGAPGVAIVSASLARRDWPGERAVGRRLKFDDDAAAPWMTVVGVVSDVHHVGLTTPAPPVMYLPYRQFSLPFATVAVRSDRPAPAVVAALREVFASVDREVPLGDVETLAAVIRGSTAESRFRLALFAAMSAVALVLAAVGLYGVVSTAVVHQTKEIGIRVALGASPRRVQRAVVGRALALAAAGVAIGLAGALAVARAIGPFLFGVAPTDPVTLASTAVALLTITLIASLVPSRRVLAVDPVAALRAER